MTKRVLLVDDEAAVLFAYRKCLRRIGCKVDAVETKEEADILLNKHQYDMAILDLRLSSSGGEEGIELISYARECQPEIKLIMITAYGSEEVKDRAYKHGADLYLEKPVSIELIQKIIESGTVQIQFQANIDKNSA